LRPKAGPGSTAAKTKDGTKRTEDDYPVQSFQSLPGDLSTLYRHDIEVSGSQAVFEQLTEPTPLQARPLALLNVTL